MTFKELARELCKRERGKKQINISDASETLARLRDILQERPQATLEALGTQVQLQAVFLPAPKKRRVRK